MALVKREATSEQRAAKVGPKQRETRFPVVSIILGTLSRGQIQRLSLARALLHSPRLLLLDEPDAGLDDEGIELLEELLREHAERGGTTLFTTHNFERAVKFSDKICMLGGGRVVYQQATSGLEPVGVRQAYQEALR